MYAPNCSLKGEIGSSLMKTRVVKGHIQYIRNILQGSNELLKKVIRIVIEEGKSKWAKTTKKYLQLVGLGMYIPYELAQKKKEEVNKQVKKWDTDQWEEEVNSKTSLKIYRNSKKNIQEDTIYDNTPASVILFQARTNTLPLTRRPKTP